MQEYSTQIAIVGGGIAGLWLYNILAQRGYEVCLIEQEALGAGQTILSQGIIHGGIKYALQGGVSNAATSISAITPVWNSCLAGTGEIDLSAVAILSQQHCLCSMGGLVAKFKSIVSQQLLANQATILKAADLPSVLQHKKFKGQVCAIDETVLSVPSLLSELAKPFAGNILQAKATPIYDKNNTIAALELNNSKIKLTADYYVFCAGSGNVTGGVKQQLRPLQQVWCKFPVGVNLDLFAHFVTTGTKPQISITTHPAKDGATVWYMGGELAEAGVGVAATKQIAKAKQLLQQLLPWVDIANCEFGTCNIDRAEQAMPGSKRPDEPGVINTHNSIVCYPVKLTYAPAMAARVVQLLPTPEQLRTTINLPHDKLTAPPIAAYPWDKE